jgi:hypothetical protein
VGEACGKNNRLITPREREKKRRRRAFFLETAKFVALCLGKRQIGARFALLRTAGLVFTPVTFGPHTLFSDKSRKQTGSRRLAEA